MAPVGCEPLAHLPLSPRRVLLALGPHALGALGRLAPLVGLPALAAPGAIRRPREGPRDVEAVDGLRRLRRLPGDAGGEGARHAAGGLGGRRPVAAVGLGSGRTCGARCPVASVGRAARTSRRRGRAWRVCGRGPRAAGLDCAPRARRPGGRQAPWPARRRARACPWARGRPRRAPRPPPRRPGPARGPRAPGPRGGPRGAGSAAPPRARARSPRRARGSPSSARRCVGPGLPDAGVAPGALAGVARAAGDAAPRAGDRVAPPPGHPGAGLVGASPDLPGPGPGDLPGLARPHRAPEGRRRHPRVPAHRQPPWSVTARPQDGGPRSRSGFSGPSVLARATHQKPRGAFFTISRVAWRTSSSSCTLPGRVFASRGTPRDTPAPSGRSPDLLPAGSPFLSGSPPLSPIISLRQR